MGVAAIWVMLFHSTICTNIRPIDTFIKIGYLGVDIFVFMSGFSMWNSFSKSCKCNAKLFISKRLKKILPTYIPFAIIYLVSYFLKNYSSMEELGVAVKTFDFWVTMALFRWFVPFIIICYFLTPPIYHIFNRFGYSFLVLVTLVGICILIAIPFAFIGSSVALMVLLRIPEFVMGWYYGARPQKEKTNLVFILLILAAIFATYYYLLGTYTDAVLFDTGFNLWPITLFSGVLVLGVSRAKVFNNAFCNFCGKYSLELYLWHQFFMFMIIDSFSKNHFTLDRFGLIVNTISIVVACLVSFLYSKFIDGMCKVLTRGSNNNEVVNK